jgi:hypothetical protein
MRGIIRFLAAFAAFTVSAQGYAANFVCGNVACSPFTTSQPITGIDDLSVRGGLFDVTFSNTLTPSPFLFSYSVSGSGQPLTGIDAANALDAFYSSQVGPSGSAGPGIITGTGFVLNYATAYQNSGIPGIIDVDLVEPFLGLPSTPVQEATLDSTSSQVTVVQMSAGGLCSASAACTIWTPVAAPEISLGSASTALLLLTGTLAVLRGRRGGVGLPVG